MSKRDSDGDVLFNRLSLGLAKHQKLLSSWIGTQPDAQPASDTLKGEEDDDDFKQELYGPDRLGVGGVVPKDVEDGNFTRRTVTSNDKLLAQLIGNKKAKAHIASKQQAARQGAQPQPRHGRQTVVKKDESEDEEEGRAAAFKSKRRKTTIATPAPAKADESEGEQEPFVEDRGGQEEVNEAPSAVEESESKNQPTAKPKSIPSRGKAKPKSYLDELLAERSKKKGKKGKASA